MKIKTIYILGLAALLGFASCGSDSEDVFDTPISDDMFSFTPYQGGATMHFTISDPNVHYVQAEYTNEYGESVKKLADMGVTTLNLDGFNNAATNVPVKISFMDRNYKVSSTVEKTFSTEKSNLLNFFDSVKVGSFWDGFRVSYRLSGQVAGSATVYFVGESQTTHVRDTITLDNFELVTGASSSHSYKMTANQQQEKYTVVLTTEDNAQHVVKREVYSDIAGLDSKILSNSGFELFDPFNKSVEDPEVHPADRAPGGLSSKYLFDGDKNGVKAMEYYTIGQTKCVPPFIWLAGPNAYADDENDCYFVLDTKQPLVVAQMRFYGNWYHPNDNYNTQLGGWIYGNNPCAVEVYGFNGTDYNVDDDRAGKYTDADWTQVGTFNQSPYCAWKDRWYNDAANNSFYSTKMKTVEEFQKAENKYFDVVFDFDGKSYRYFKLRFLDHYLFKQAINGYSMSDNNTNLLMLSEIDVFANANK